MIISASRRTDIPAFWGDKFYNSLINGKFKTVNPYNHRISILEIKKEDIDGIVFWSKHPESFFENIKKIKKTDIPFYFQYTINNYPRTIEPAMLDIDKRIDTMRKLYEIIFPNKIIWRYDPIIITDIFDLNFHSDNFEMILSKIHPFITDITVSVLTIYRKIRKFFNNIINDDSIAKEIIVNLKDISMRYKKTLKTCCCNIEGIERAKCIDGNLFGNNLNIKKHIGQRAECNCDKSVDVGYYGTCRHKCLYCYAM